MFNQANIKKDFRIVRLSAGDVHHLTDNWLAFKELISANEEMYPGIDRWLKNKVMSELKSPHRVAYIGYNEDKPVVTAVLKRAAKSKLCHLRILDEYQDMLVGEVFFSLMTLEVRNDAQELHFTLPETLWERERCFFKSFGFTEARYARTQYRSSENELMCSAPFYKVFGCVLSKLPRLASHFSIRGHTMDNTLLFSIKPGYVAKILDGTKSVEIRRRFSDKWIGHRASLYASYPVCGLAGEAFIKDAIAGSPECIWDMYGHQMGCTKTEYNAYVENTERVFAIILDDVQAFSQIVSLEIVKNLVEENLKPPQSYMFLEKGKPWAKALSIATLLNGLF